MRTPEHKLMSHSELRISLQKVGAKPEQIEEILASYPDPLDVMEAEPSLFSRYGLTLGGLTDRMGGSP